MDYIFLIALWTAWCVLHSAMISIRATNYIKNKLGEKYRFYRLSYNIIAIATFIPVLLYTRSLSGYVIFHWENHLMILKAGLMLVAALLFIFGFLKYDMLELVGIRQIKSRKSGIAITQNHNIDTSGILSLIRHPLYLAVLIFIWIYHQNIYTSTLIINIILTIYIMVGAMLEENKLIQEFGDEYRQYQDKVSMWLPIKWIVVNYFKGSR